MEALPPPTAAGLLAKTPLAHLFTYVMERRLSGSLELLRPDGHSGTIVFFDGIPRKARAPEGAPANEPGPLAALEAQIQTLFESPFETQFAFYEGRDTLEAHGQPFVEADPLRLLWAGIRLNPSWDHVNAALARVQTVAIRLNAAAVPERCGFNAAEQQIVELLRQRPVRLTDLAAARLVSPSVAQLFVYFLLITKQLELIEGPSSAVRAQPLTAQVARVQLQARQVRAPAIVEEHRPSRPDARMSPPPQAYAIPDEVRASPAPAAPAPPPEAPFNPFASVLASVAASPPPPPSRPAVAPPTAPIASPATPASPPPAAPASPAASPADEALRAKIVAKAASIEAEDHYQVLGIDRTMAKEDIQKSFFALAKMWHPDKLPASLGDLRDSCSKVFARVTEAHAVLTDPARRDEYDKALRDGVGTAAEQEEVQRALEAANNFQKALIFLKRNDTAIGEELARKALAADPTQADYLALVTWLESQKPSNQGFDRTRDLIYKLDEAIRMNGNCERAHFYRGMLHKRTDNPKQAIKDFKRAVELNPHNLDAAREIRLHGMRQPAAPAGKPEGSIGGLFGRLFKK